MKSFKSTFALSFLMIMLSSCGQTQNDEQAVAETTVPLERVLEEDIKEADLKAEQRVNVLQNPNWQPVEHLPLQWGGLYARECLMAGPEDSRFFQYHDAEISRQYFFNYVVFPKDSGIKPSADIVIVDYKVWKNEDWPDHYLLFGFKGFSQIEIRDGVAHGLHQTLDGRPWDILENFNKEYRETDKSRWAVDLNNLQDYGTEAPCDKKLAEPWTDIKFFHKDTGKRYTLEDVMR